MSPKTRIVVEHLCQHRVGDQGVKDPGRAVRLNWSKLVTVDEEAVLHVLPLGRERIGPLDARKRLEPRPDTEWARRDFPRERRPAIREPTPVLEAARLGKFFGPASQTHHIPRDPGLID